MTEVAYIQPPCQHSVLVSWLVQIIFIISLRGKISVLSAVLNVLYCLLTG